MKMQKTALTNWTEEVEYHQQQLQLQQQKLCTYNMTCWNIGDMNSAKLKSHTTLTSSIQSKSSATKITHIYGEHFVLFSKKLKLLDFSTVAITNMRSSLLQMKPSKTVTTRLSYFCKIRRQFRVSWRLILPKTFFHTMV